MHTLSASEARANFHRLMEDVAAAHQPICISGKRNRAVLVSLDDWRGIQETLHLLSVSGMRESILAAMAEPVGNSAERLEW